MSVEQIESTLLQLPPEERRRFADWFYQHEDEIIAPLDNEEIHPDAKAELLRRRDEVTAHPELMEPVTGEWFEGLKRKLADARSAKTPAR